MRFALYATVLAALAGAPASALPYKKCNNHSVDPITPTNDAPANEVTDGAAGQPNVPHNQFLGGHRQRPTSWQQWQDMFSQYFPKPTGGVVTPPSDDAPTSTQDAPIPTQDAPTSIQDAPPQETPTSNAPTDNAPTDNAPTENAPPQTTPTEAAPTTVPPPAATSDAAPSPVAPSTPPQQDSGASESGSLAEVMVAKHNAERAAYGAGPVTWNEDMAKEAAAHAAQCVWGHTPSDQRNGQGENIACSTNQDGGDMFTMWADEREYYNFANPGPTPTTQTMPDGSPVQIGHWTQIVWKETTEIGCAVSNCGNIQGAGFGGNYLVCRYRKPGNMQGWDAASTTNFYSTNVGNKV